MKWFLQGFGIVLLFFLISCAGLEEAGTEGTDPGHGGGTATTTDTVSPEKETGGSRTGEPAESPAPQPEPAEIASEGSGAEDTSAKPAVRGAKSMEKEESWVLSDDEESPAGTSATATVASTSSRGPSESGLKAGYADDNRQYGYFIDFLEEYGYVDHIEMPVNERIILAVRDRNGKSIPNAAVEITGNGAVLARGVTHADGSYQFNPSEYDRSLDEYEYSVTWMQNTGNGILSRDGVRTISVDLPLDRYVQEPIPLDVVFVMDTTGSMGEEIARLRATIELIHLNLTNLPVPTVVRFGMVLYKDIGDEYRTRVVPLDTSLERFQSSLNLVEASGGGDTPEDLQAALERTVNEMEWSAEGIRLAFVVTDAPPHLDYKNQYTYAEASRRARGMGIKIFTVGTGGLGIDGEYILRQISQYTSAKYIFLTYGEEGESAGGQAGSVSHHTGANWKADKLESIIIRFAKEELSFLTDQPLEAETPYYEATKIDVEEKDETLSKLFSMALGQLLDFSSIDVPSETTAAVIPIAAVSDELAVSAEYFTERLNISVAEGDQFTLVERKDIQKIIEEQKLQLTGITDGEGVVELGRILNAEVLITGKLYPRNGYELFLKLLRVETGEVLSITKAIIDPDLGL